MASRCQQDAATTPAPTARPRAGQAPAQRQACGSVAAASCGIRRDLAEDCGAPPRPDGSKHRPPRETTTKPRNSQSLFTQSALELNLDRQVGIRFKPRRTVARCGDSQRAKKRGIIEENDENGKPSKRLKTKPSERAGQMPRMRFHPYQKSIEESEKRCCNKPLARFNYHHNGTRTPTNKRKTRQ